MFLPKMSGIRRHNRKCDCDLLVGFGSRLFCRTLVRAAACTAGPIARVEGGPGRAELHGQGLYWNFRLSCIHCIPRGRPSPSIGVRRDGFGVTGVGNEEMK